MESLSALGMIIMFLFLASLPSSMIAPKPLNISSANRLEGHAMHTLQEKLIGCWSWAFGQWPAAVGRWLAATTVGCWLLAFHPWPAASGSSSSSKRSCANTNLMLTCIMRRTRRITGLESPDAGLG